MHIVTLLTSTTTIAAGSTDRTGQACVDDVMTARGGLLRGFGVRGDRRDGLLRVDAVLAIPPGLLTLSALPPYLLLPSSHVSHRPGVRERDQR